MYIYLIFYYKLLCDTKLIWFIYMIMVIFPHSNIFKNLYTLFTFKILKILKIFWNLRKLTKKYRKYQNNN